VLHRTVLAAALVVLTACGDGFLATTRFVTSLRAARARWESRGIDTYEVTMRHLCFCGFLAGPVRVKVVDGSIVSRTVVPTGEPVPELYASFYPDVPGLFAIVERATKDADDFDAEFNPNYGYPADISIDWIENAVDDEEGYVVETFTITP
jgi:hypothetical protein